MVPGTVCRHSTFTKHRGGPAEVCGHACRATRLCICAGHSGTARAAAGTQNNSSGVLGCMRLRAWVLRARICGMVLSASATRIRRACAGGCAALRGVLQKLPLRAYRCLRALAGPRGVFCGSCQLAGTALGRQPQCRPEHSNAFRPESAKMSAAKTAGARWLLETVLVAVASFSPGPCGAPLVAGLPAQP